MKELTALFSSSRFDSRSTNICYKHTGLNQFSHVNSCLRWDYFKSLKSNLTLYNKKNPKNGAKIFLGYVCVCLYACTPYEHNFI